MPNVMIRSTSYAQRHAGRVIKLRREFSRHLPHALTNIVESGGSVSAHVIGYETSGTRVVISFERTLPKARFNTYDGAPWLLAAHGAFATLTVAPDAFKYGWSIEVAYLPNVSFISNEFKAPLKFSKDFSMKSKKTCANARKIQADFFLHRAIALLNRINPGTIPERSTMKDVVELEKEIKTYLQRISNEHPTP